MADTRIIEKLRQMIRDMEAKAKERPRSEITSQVPPLGGGRGAGLEPYCAHERTMPVAERLRVAEFEPVGSSEERSQNLKILHFIYPVSETWHLQPLQPVEIDALSSVEPSLSSSQPWVFLDIETTGLFGAATVAFLVGLGLFEGEGFAITQFLLMDRDGEPALLQAVHDALRDCRVLVTFNGRGFDLPLLNNRFIVTGTGRPLCPAAHLDLLRVVRGMGKIGGAGCSLQDAVRRFLGTARLRDIPGRLVPTMYFLYERERNESHLQPVLSHNRLDILDMARLTKSIAGFLAGSRVDSGDWQAFFGSGKMHLRSGRTHLALRCFEQALCSPAARRDPKLRSISCQVLRREGLWDRAKEIWQEAVSGGYATCEDYLWLARYYEVVLKDPAHALSIVEEAAELFEREGSGPPEALVKRLSRLRKMVS